MIIRLTQKEFKLIKKALVFAIEWETITIDSWTNCDIKWGRAETTKAKKNILKFETLRKKLIERGKQYENEKNVKEKNKNKQRKTI
jgi:hypothetical protein